MTTASMTSWLSRRPRPTFSWGRLYPWPETIDVKADAAVIIENTQTATGLGDINGDGLVDWAATRDGAILIYYGSEGYAVGEQHAALADSSFPTADTAPYLAALGDVNDDDLTDFAFSDGATPRLVLGRSEGSWGRLPVAHRLCATTLRLFGRAG